MPHIHEHYDFVVSPYIVYNGKVLLVHHPRYNKWINPGGHIELDEDPEEALYREIAEETGLTVHLMNPKPDVKDADSKILPTPNFMDVHDANLPHRHIALIYFLIAESPDFVLSDEHLGARWFSQADLHDPQYALNNSVIFFAEEALKQSQK